MKSLEEALTLARYVDCLHVWWSHLTVLHPHHEIARWRDAFDQVVINFERHSSKTDDTKVLKFAIVPEAVVAERFV
ncbi:MAG TPA: hypothetical protein VKP52_16585 [Pseudolabrys sp.]|nr:hypothetical protein [Pseudolabrys sp.]